MSLPTKKSMGLCMIVKNEAAAIGKTASGFAIRINGDGGRSQDPRQYRKDAELLEHALQKETDAFLRSRYTFYLADSYRELGEGQKALDFYLARAEMGFWQEEVFVALLSAARLKEELEYPEDDVIAAYQRATDSQPARIEALHGASRYCRFKGRNQQGAEIARRGIDLPMSVAALFAEAWIYEWGLLDEFAVNAYWSGDYHGCIAACLRILECKSIDEATRKRVIANARFALDKLRGALGEAAHSVIVLGDSVVECMYLDPDDRFCAKLETILRGEHGLDVAVRNGGYSGATTLHMLNVFLNKVIPLKPELVILMTGMIDADVVSLPASFWSQDCWPEPFVELSEKDAWCDDSRPRAASSADRRRLLDLFSAAARAFGIELWFATIPHRHGDEVDPAKTQARLSTNEVTRAAARAGAQTLCDLEVELAERSDIFQDDFHLNRGGSEAVARSLIASGLDLLLRSGATIRTRARNAQSTGEIHVINLDRSTARWKSFEARNGHLGQFERASAVDGNAIIDRSSLEREGIIAPGLDYGPGQLGAALSHIRLWQKAVAESVPLTIFEDDAFSHPAFNEHRTAVSAQLPVDWDIMFWGYNYDPLFLWVDLGFSSSEMRLYNRVGAFTWSDTSDGRSIYLPMKLKHELGLIAYSISPRGAKRFLTAVLPLKKQFIQFPGTEIVIRDVGVDCAMNLVYPEARSFMCIPPLVVQRDGGISEVGNPPQMTTV